MGSAVVGSSMVEWLTVGGRVGFAAIVAAGGVGGCLVAVGVLAAVLAAVVGATADEVVVERAMVVQAGPNVA